MTTAASGTGPAPVPSTRVTPVRTRIIARPSGSVRERRGDRLACARVTPICSPAVTTSCHVAGSSGTPARCRASRESRSGSPGTSTGLAGSVAGDAFT